MISRFLILILSIVIYSGCSATGASQLEGRQAPVTRMYSLKDGAIETLEDYKGKTVVISFWATTCNSANPIMRRLTEYAEKFQHDPRVVFIAISLDKQEDFDQLKERIKYSNYNVFRNMFSGNAEYDEAYRALLGDRLPYVVVIDRNGNVVKVDNDDSFVYSLVTPNGSLPLAKLETS